MRNLGLGYDNTIKQYRSSKASDFVDAELRYQEELANEMGYRATWQHMQNGILPEEWRLRKRAMQLANRKENIAIKNMRLQNNLLSITERFERWSKDILRKRGFIPGFTTSRSSGSSSSASFIWGTGGSSSESSHQTKPFNFNVYGSQW